MIIKYKIVSVDDNQKLFTVRYFTDLITEDELAAEFDIDGDIIRNSNGYPVRCRTDMNISIYDENDTSMENVHLLIVRSAPIKYLEIAEKNKTNALPSIVNIISSINNVVEINTDTEPLLNDDSKGYELENNVILKGNLVVTGTITGNIISNTQ